MDELEETQQPGDNEKVPEKTENKHHLSGMYENWFLDYASYVILERAVPEVEDGLKPVQRRILHAMSRLDDGRFNKVANIIGHTMQFHPHGDASIGDALVQLAQKELLIDMQGNWGNTFTGDSAAAPRYIEARLSAFAKEVVFNPKTTQWKASYDGRNKEPIALPVKFPLLLAQGVEGIAVGLASKILPHNFIELIDASVRHLQGKDFELFPDFLTGGLADFSKYNEGLRGGKVRIRAKISQKEKNTLVITQIPFTTTTSSLIDSVVAANDKGKIKIKKIDDNTAENVEIVIYLANNVSPDQTIDALYAFTNCEVSISPNACVIADAKPQFISIKEILRRNTDQTVYLLRRELEIKLGELEDQWHHSSLEKIFIENRIYLQIEECETWECVTNTIDKGLEPFKKLLKRVVTYDDLIRLTEIKIKRISKFNALKAIDDIKSVENDIEEVSNHLAHLTDYAINYYRQIKKKYGKSRKRKTEIRSFDNIQAASVAVANQKLYVNCEEGFMGTALKKNKYITECSDLDDIIVFRKNGSFVVTKVAPKVFVGKEIIHIDVFKKNDDRTIYNMIFRDGKSGKYYVKRFAVLGVTRDREYDLTKGTSLSNVIYFTANPNGEAETVRINLRSKTKMKKNSFDFDFSSLAIKARSSKGIILSRNSIRNIIKRDDGISTLGARDIWYDDTVRRLNTDERGQYLGAFKGDDKLLAMHSSGEYKLTSFELSSHFDDEMNHLSKFDANKIISVVYFDGNMEKYYVKRFQISETTTINRKYSFIPESKGSRFVNFSLDYLPRLEMEIKLSQSNEVEFEIVLVSGFIGIKSYKAKGKRLTNKQVQNINFIEPLPFQAPAKEDENESADDVKKNNAKQQFDAQPVESPVEKQMKLSVELSENSGQEKIKKKTIIVNSKVNTSQMAGKEKLQKKTKKQDKSNNTQLELF